VFLRDGVVANLHRFGCCGGVDVREGKQNTLWTNRIG
jgi:hypothetical protein